MRLPVQKQIWWWGGAGLLLALALWRLGNVMTPFLLGAGIAYVLDPIVDRLERSGLRRPWAVALITLVAALAFAAVLLLIVPTLIRQVTQLIVGLPEFLDRAQGFVAIRFPNLLPEGGTLTTVLDNAGAAIADHGGTLVVGVLTSLGNILGVIALLVIVPVVAFYLLLDWDRMVTRVDELLPREHLGSIRRLASDIDDSLAGFLRGQGLVTLMLGTFYAVGLFAIGLPFGVLIGISAAILSIIPYVGVFIGGVTAIGVAIIHFWGEPWWIAGVAAIFAVGQFVEGNYLQPKIIGGHIGLHPVWLMLALAVFGTLFGFVGLIVAVPLAAMVGVLARFAASRYKESALYTGRQVPPPPTQPTLVELVPRGTVTETRRRAEAAKAVAVAEVRVEEARREAARLAEEAARETGSPAATATVAVVADAQVKDVVPELVAVSSVPGPSVIEAGADAVEEGRVAAIDEAAQDARRAVKRLAEAAADDPGTISAAVAVLSDPAIADGAPAVVAAVPPVPEGGGADEADRTRSLHELARDAALAALEETPPVDGPVGAMAAAAAALPPGEGEAAEGMALRSLTPDQVARELGPAAAAAADPKVASEALFGASEGLDPPVAEPDDAAKPSR
ncbi:AI-2E family transporter [Paracoccus sp. S-4012]|uniref:AI-2E family transporter n=1 Tax=Paracoccus sp. S-4012 TaxID=2665648 RepID=UPI001E2A804D|nr:AI-2E family transporter [Paracoccus sp. S-4012]